MKKIVIGLTFFSALLLAWTAYTQVRFSSLGFVAPSLSDLSVIYMPEKGEVVFDTSINQFFGNRGTPTNPEWVQLSGSGTSSPAGTIITYGGTSCPSGYLAADGTAISRSSYLNLFSAIGTTWGGGDGTTTFNLPDLRNRFLRGSGTNGDAQGGTSVNVGQFQNDSFQGHWHNFWSMYTAQSGSSTNVLTVGTPNADLGNSYVRNAVSDGTNGTPRVSSETRPKAYGVLMCIKT